MRLTTQDSPCQRIADGAADVAYDVLETAAASAVFALWLPLFFALWVGAAFVVGMAAQTVLQLAGAL